MRDHPMWIFTGRANPALAKAMCSHANCELGNAAIQTFPDGELNVKVNTDVRGTDAFVVQPTCPPVNDHLMELLLLVDCLRRASAARVTAVLPYYGYARKDRKDEGRVPISAKLVANLIVTAGAHRVLALDLHASQIQGFFDIPTDHLFAAPELVRRLRRARLKDLVLVSPDVGSLKLARVYAQGLRAGMAVVDKRRVAPDRTEADFFIGDVRGKNVLIIDDMIATGSSVREAARILRDNGAEAIYVAATHGIFCGNAIENLAQADLARIFVTDSIPQKDEVLEALPVEVVCVAKLLGQAVRRIHRNESVSSLLAMSTGRSQKSPTPPPK